MNTEPGTGDDDRPQPVPHEPEGERIAALFSDDHRGSVAAAFGRLIDPGFRWTGVQRYEASLRELDTWPDKAEVPAETGRPIDLVDAQHWAERLDGVRVSLCGQQSRLQQISTTDGHQEWIFCMESNQNRATAFSFVRLRLSLPEQPHSSLPPTEPADHITWASGYFVARGTAILADTDPVDGTSVETESDGRSCMYLVADHVYFTPKAKTRREQRGSLGSRLRAVIRRG